MQRDMDLIRAILLRMEEHEHGFAPHPFAIPDYPDDQVGYHVLLLKQAGLITALPFRLR